MLVQRGRGVEWPCDLFRWVTRRGLGRRIAETVVHLVESLDASLEFVERERIDVGVALFIEAF